MTRTTLVTWGNSQGIRLPKSLVEKAGLSIGDHLEATAEDGIITLTPVERNTIGIPDFGSLFADYHGPQPQEDGFAKPMGGERL